MNKKQAKTLKKLVRWAENDAKTPDKLKKFRWNQETWATKEKLEPKARCQTACCIAGGAVVLAGGRFLYDKRELREDGIVDVTDCFYKGEEHSIEALGRELLGLSHREADELFDGDNTLTEVQNISHRILEEHGYA